MGRFQNMESAAEKIAELHQAVATAEQESGSAAAVRGQLEARIAELETRLQESNDMDANILQTVNTTVDQVRSACLASLDFFPSKHGARCFSADRSCQWKAAMGEKDAELAAAREASWRPFLQSNVGSGDLPPCCRHRVRPLAGWAGPPCAFNPGPGDSSASP
jgi:hypothetical protein